MLDFRGGYSLTGELQGKATPDDGGRKVPFSGFLSGDLSARQLKLSDRSG